MKILFHCQICGHKLKAPPELSGRAVRCSRCGTAQNVPQESTRRASRSRKKTVVDDSPLALPLKFSAPTLGSEEEVDMTPMIDVVFQLLIFFMVTAAFSLQKSIELPTPEATDSASQNPTLEELEQDDDFVIVRVDADNTIWVNDAQTPSRQDLLIKLREARRGLSATSQMSGPRKLLVLASGEAEHEYVIRALDAGAEVGMDDVRLATAEEEYW